ncbi:unnamed protein product [Ranitomeya imitator]|uniref:Sam68 tyrosine-rich domain-containing protein n=1 Tax=Ranitomeya imitator TaxID=111125 RepID=A0ABN9MI71_9NEOB|nr:unnamed protein product [Ranitomeya imitator]
MEPHQRLHVEEGVDHRVVEDYHRLHLLQQEAELVQYVLSFHEGFQVEEPLHVVPVSAEGYDDLYAEQSYDAYDSYYSQSPGDTEYYDYGHGESLESYESYAKPYLAVILFAV